VQQVEISLPPIGRSEAQPGDKGKQQDKNRQSGPVYFLHDVPFPFGAKQI
jgi:hypothetical protein